MSPARHRRTGRFGAFFDLITLVALTFAAPPVGFVMAARYTFRAARARRPGGVRLFGTIMALSVVTSAGLYAAIRGNQSLALLCETVAVVAFIGLVLRSVLDGTFRLIRVLDRRAS